MDLRLGKMIFWEIRKSRNVCRAGFSTLAASHAGQTEGSQRGCRGLRDGRLGDWIRMGDLRHGLSSGKFIQRWEGHIKELEIAVGDAIGESHRGRQILATCGLHGGKGEHRDDGESGEFFHGRVGLCVGGQGAVGSVDSGIMSHFRPLDITRSRKLRIS